MSDTSKYPKGYIFVTKAKAQAAAVAAEQDGTSMLAEYDKRGGLLKNAKGEVIPAGTFWDFEKGKPRAKKSAKKSTKQTAKK